MYDNLFMTVIVISLVVFLIWCYIEKKRQDAIQEKYFQKIYLKSIENDTEFFVKDPEPVNIQEIFDEINKNIKEPSENTQDKIEVINPKVFTNPVPPVLNKNTIIHGPENNNSGKYMDISNFNSNSFML
jgi:hypothetical protein